MSVVAFQQSYHIPEYLITGNENSNEYFSYNKFQHSNAIPATASFWQ
jgi:hypothetical protein